MRIFKQPRLGMPLERQSFATPARRLFSIAAAGLLSCGVLSQASGDILLPSQVTATASSENLSAENTVNLDGLSGSPGAEVHDTDTGGLWLTSSSDTAPWIKWEFDANYAIDEVNVWNYNQSGVASRGMRHTKIETSLDNVNWVTLDADYELAIASGNVGQAKTDTIDFGNVVARYVRFSGLPITAGSDSGNWGHTSQYGLSEVQFVIPEPGSLMLFGFGTLLVAKRRRTTA